MRRSKLGFAGALGVALLVAVGCTNNSLDDGAGPNVVLQIEDIQAEPVSATQNQDGVCSGDGITACGTDADCTSQAPPIAGPCLGSTCTINLQEWTVSLANVPKTPLATQSPFNDVVIETITIGYSWVNGFTNGPLVLGSGVIVPADGTADVNFFPITAEDFDALQVFAPNVPATANLSLTFQGHVLDSDSIGVGGAAQLQVEACQ